MLLHQPLYVLPSAAVVAKFAINEFLISSPSKSNQTEIQSIERKGTGYNFCVCGVFDEEEPRATIKGGLR